MGREGEGEDRAIGLETGGVAATIGWVIGVGAGRGWDGAGLGWGVSVGMR